MFSIPKIVFINVPFLSNSRSYIPVTVSSCSMLGKISLSISLKIMWVGNANILPLFAYIFLHNLQTTVDISVGFIDWSFPDLSESEEIPWTGFSFPGEGKEFLIMVGSTFRCHDSSTSYLDWLSVVRFQLFPFE